MGLRNLSDMYAQGPRAAGQRAEGIHISSGKLQASMLQVIRITSGTLKMPKLTAVCSVYLLPMGNHCHYGIFVLIFLWSTVRCSGFGHGFGSTAFSRKPALRNTYINAGWI